MSTYQQRPGDVSVFLERNKTNPKAPDWKGFYTDLDGIKHEIALWNKGDKGTMLAGSIKPVRSVERPAKTFDEDSPF